ncbi:hypothetical protein Tco_0127711 [Tanacetum coccineum]
MAKIQEVLPAESSSTDTPLKQVQNHDVFANERRHSEQPESINDTYVLEKDDSNVTPDSSNICNNDNQVDQNAAECVDERAALLKKANVSLNQELKECKTNLDESSRALGEATSSRDSCLIVLQTKQTELEKYTTLLPDESYEISVVNQKHDELSKESDNRVHNLRFQLKEKTKVILDLKVKEGKDIDTMIEMDKQIKSTFANPKYLKRAQSDKPCLYEIPYDTFDPANRFAPDGEEIVTLAKEMNDDLEYVKSLEKEIDELESEKADFSNMYDLLLEECVSKDVICSYLHSLSELNAHTELQCMYLHKVKECECLAQKLSKQTESVNNEVHNKLLKSFAKLEKHSISLELSLQHCKEQMKNNPVCKENASNVFRKEREQYHEIQDLKAQMQDKNMVISELKKLIEKCKGKSVETQFDKPSVVRQPNAQRIPKPSVLGKPTPFSNSPEMRSFQTN